MIMTREKESYNASYDECNMGISQYGIKQKIKLVIWDLDDTLWRGTLAEGDTVKPFENRFEIVSHLNQRGIVSAIVSKNNYDQAKKKIRIFWILGKICLRENIF